MSCSGAGFFEHLTSDQLNLQIDQQAFDTCPKKIIETELFQLSKCNKSTLNHILYIYSYINYGESNISCIPEYVASGHELKYIF